MKASSSSRLTLAAFQSLIHTYSAANGISQGEPAAPAPARVTSGTSSNSFLQFSVMFPGLRVSPPPWPSSEIVSNFKTTGGSRGGVIVTKVPISCWVWRGSSDGHPSANVLSNASISFSLASRAALSGVWLIFRAAVFILAIRRHRRHARWRSRGAGRVRRRGRWPG